LPAVFKEGRIRSPVRSKFHLAAVRLAEHLQPMNDSRFAPLVGDCQLPGKQTIRPQLKMQ